MVRLICLSLLVGEGVFGADFVKPLTPKDLTLKLPEAVKLVDGPQVCAIPLREIRSGNSKTMDPMARAGGKGNFDKGIARPVPIPVCQSR